MQPSIISALAALVGAIIGGFTSVLASWLVQRAQARAEWLTHTHMRRQELNKEFIENAAECYADALQDDEPDIRALVGLYAKIDRMRVYSSPKIVESAMHVRRKILDTFLDTNKSFPELRGELAAESVDLLSSFGESCRIELDSIRAKQF